MKRFKSDVLAQILSFVALALFVVPLNNSTAFAQEPETRITPKPLEYFVSEHRIKVGADVADEAGVKVVRCYFRASGQADYVFVQMEPVKGNTYEGILPKPDTTTQTLEYIFLAVSQKGQIVKTETFKVEKGEGKEVPEWQKVVSEDEIRVSTELAKAPETLAGFKDSVALDVAESAGRFGSAAGIYMLLQSGGTSGTAAATATATTAGSAGGLSGGAIAGIAAALVGGGVVAANSGGGGGGSDGPRISPSDPQTLLCGESRIFSASGGKEPYEFHAVDKVKDQVLLNGQFNASDFDCPDTVTITVKDADGDTGSVTVTIKANVNINLPQ